MPAIRYYDMHFNIARVLESALASTILWEQVLVTPQ